MASPNNFTHTYDPTLFKKFGIQEATKHFSHDNNSLIEQLKAKLRILEKRKAEILAGITEEENGIEGQLEDSTSLAGLITGSNHIV